MATANPYWGAPCIHGELLKLAMEISERTVSQLIPRYRKPPSQAWKAFLNNYVDGLVSVNFFTLPTVFDPRSGPDLWGIFPQSPQRSRHHRSNDRTVEPLAKSVCGKMGGLHPTRVLGSRDCVGTEASEMNPDRLFRLLSGFENSLDF
jgi:hypothetical protein